MHPPSHSGPRRYDALDHAGYLDARQLKQLAMEILNEYYPPHGARVRRQGWVRGDQLPGASRRRMSPSLSAGKPGLNTATVRPAPASPAKRFIPGYVGEPIVGHVTALKNPDGSWVAPGGKFQPGAHLALRPFYGVPGRSPVIRARSGTRRRSRRPSRSRPRTTGCRARSSAR